VCVCVCVHLLVQIINVSADTYTEINLYRKCPPTCFDQTHGDLKGGKIKGCVDKITSGRNRCKQKPELKIPHTDYQQKK